MNPTARAVELRKLAGLAERAGTERALELARRLRLRAAEVELGPDLANRTDAPRDPTRRRRVRLP